MTHFHAADAQCPLHNTRATCFTSIAPSGRAAVLAVPVAECAAICWGVSAPRRVPSEAGRAHRRWPCTWSCTAHGRCNARSSWCRPCCRPGSAQGRRERAGRGVLAVRGRGGAHAGGANGWVRATGWGDAAAYARGADRKRGRDGEEYEAHRGKMECGLDDDIRRFGIGGGRRGEGRALGAGGVLFMVLQHCRLRPPAARRGRRVE
jgi:hypothetical protein